MSQLVSRHPCNTRKARGSFHLEVEKLEDRTVLTTIVGLTTANQLVTFDSSTPGTIASQVRISGLVGSSETVLGIDFRPATGQLFGVSNKGRVYAINPTTGKANQVGTQLNPTITGSAIGISFDPIEDMIRVVSNSGQNVEIDPDTGAACYETNVAYAAGDINFGKTPNITGASYDQNCPPTECPPTLPTLYDIDSSRDALVRQGGIMGSPSPDNGQLFTIGKLGVEINTNVGFAIDSNGVAWASFNVPDTSKSQLYTINLATGQASFVGKILSNNTLRDITTVAECSGDSSASSAAQNPAHSAQQADQFFVVWLESQRREKTKEGT